MARKAVKEDHGHLPVILQYISFDLRAHSLIFYIINLNLSKWIFIFITFIELIENNSRYWTRCHNMLYRSSCLYWWCQMKRWLILKVAFHTKGMHFFFDDILKHFKCLWIQIIRRMKS